jgi:hypothetical protein
MRCDGDEPCRHCRSIHITCRYASKASERAAGDLLSSNASEAVDVSHLELPNDTATATVQLATPGSNSVTLPSTSLFNGSGDVTEQADATATASDFLFNTNIIDAAAYNNDIWQFPSLVGDSIKSAIATY